MTRKSKERQRDRDVGLPPGEAQGASSEAVLALALARNVTGTRISKHGALGPLTRVAVYARYSSDGQTEHSVERQERLCSRYLRLIGVRDYTLFADRAKSGKSMVGRGELVHLLEACDRQEYDLVVVEDYDRWTREVYDAIPMAERLERAGVEFHSAAAERRYTKEDIVAAALRAEHDRIRRRNLTLAGRLQLVERGGVPTGRIFGYRDGDVPGFLVIDDEQANVVRRIYDLADKGMSYRTIARILTADRVPNPSGRRRWANGTVRYILGQVLFTGLVAYGRTESVSERGGKAAVIRPRPADEVPTRYVEAYRIVSDDQFLRIAERRARGSVRGRRHSVQLLTERVYCDCPGAEGNAFGPQRCRLVCLTGAQFGDCKAERASLGRVEVEAEILAVVAEKLGAEGRARFAASLRQSLDGDAAERAGERERIEAEIAEIDGQLDVLLSRMLAREWGAERVERNRAELQGTVVALRKRLAALRVPDVDVEGAVRRLADLDAAVARVRARLPFVAKDQADADFVHALRQIVRRVDVRQASAAPDRVGIAIHLDYMAPMFGTGGDAYVEVIHREVHFARAKKLYAARRAETVDLMRSGGARLTDEQWHRVRRAIPDTTDRDGADGTTMREVVDALMAHLRTGYSLCPLKPIVARPVADALRRLVRAAGDVVLLDALRAHDPSTVDGLRLDALESYRKTYAAPRRGPDGHTPHTRLHALDGSTALTDAQWAATEPRLLPREGTAARPAEPEPRALVEAILLKLRTEVSWRHVPDRFGPWRQVFSATRRLVYGGSWDRVVEAWRLDCPELLEGLDTSTLDSHRRKGLTAPARAPIDPGRVPRATAGAGRGKGARARAARPGDAATRSAPPAAPAGRRASA